MASWIDYCPLKIRSTKVNSIAAGCTLFYPFLQLLPKLWQNWNTCWKIEMGVKLSNDWLGRKDIYSLCAKNSLQFRPQLHNPQMVLYSLLRLAKQGIKSRLIVSYIKMCNAKRQARWSLIVKLIHTVFSRKTNSVAKVICCGKLLAQLCEEALNLGLSSSCENNFR